MITDMPSTEVFALDAQAVWHFHDIASRGAVEHFIEALAGTLARKGFPRGDIDKSCRLFQEAYRKVCARGTAMAPEAPLKLSYRLAKTYLHIQLDSPAPEGSDTTLPHDDQTSVRFLVLRGRYALWYEYIGRGGRWRVRHHRFVP